MQYVANQASCACVYVTMCLEHTYIFENAQFSEMSPCRATSLLQYPPEVSVVVDGAPLPSPQSFDTRGLKVTQKDGMLLSAGPNEYSSPFWATTETTTPSCVKRLFCSFWWCLHIRRQSSNCSPSHGARPFLLQRSKDECKKLKYWQFAWNIYEIVMSDGRTRYSFCVVSLLWPETSSSSIHFAST